MIKDAFTITPESGSNNGTITATAGSNTEEIQRTAIISVSGGSIIKSVNLIQEPYIDIYTPWVKRVDSS